jgi:hypothetical protein
MSENNELISERLEREERERRGEQEEKIRHWFHTVSRWIAPTAAFLTIFSADKLTLQRAIACVGLSLTFALIAVATRR